MPHRHASKHVRWIMTARLQARPRNTAVRVPRKIRDANSMSSGRDMTSRFRDAAHHTHLPSSRGWKENSGCQIHWDGSLRSGLSAGRQLTGDLHGPIPSANPWLLIEPILPTVAAWCCHCGPDICRRKSTSEGVTGMSGIPLRTVQGCRTMAHWARFRSALPTWNASAPAAGPQVAGEAAASHAARLIRSQPGVSVASCPHPRPFGSVPQPAA